MAKKNIRPKTSEEKSEKKELRDVELLTSKQAAEYLNISIVSLKRLRLESGLHGITPPPFVRLSTSDTGGIRYIKTELTEWVLNQPRFNTVSREPYCDEEGKAV